MLPPHRCLPLYRYGGRWNPPERFHRGLVFVRHLHIRHASTAIAKPLHCGRFVSLGSTPAESVLLLRLTLVYSIIEPFKVLGFCYMSGQWWSSHSVAGLRKTNGLRSRNWRTRCLWGNLYILWIGSVDGVKFRAHPGRLLSDIAAASSLIIFWSQLVLRLAPGVSRSQ